MKRSLALLAILFVLVNLVLYFANPRRYLAFISMLPHLVRRENPGAREQASDFLESIKNPDGAGRAGTGTSPKGRRPGISVYSVESKGELVFEVSVIEERSQKPLPMTTVEVSSTDRRLEFQGWTDAAGRFRFRTPSGGFKIVARREGYSSVERRVTIATAPGADEERKLSIVLSPKCLVAGVVTDTWGKPAAGVEIFAVRLDIPTAKFSLPPGSLRSGSFAETNRRGEFSTSVAPGKYQLFARHKLFGDAESEVVSVEPSLRPLVVRMVLRHATHLLTGIVRDADGNAVEGAQVSVSYLEESGERKPFFNGKIAVTGKGGEFLIEQLRPGPVHVVASHRELGIARQRIELAQIETHIEARLQKP